MSQTIVAQGMGICGIAGKAPMRVTLDAKQPKPYSLQFKMGGSWLTLQGYTYQECALSDFNGRRLNSQIAV